MSNHTAEIEAAAQALHQRLAEIGGCLDGNCIVVKPSGMHTNGGCRCLSSQIKAQRVVYAYRNFTDAITALVRPATVQAQSAGKGKK